MTTSNPRNQPGIVEKGNSFHLLPNIGRGDRWLRGNHGQGIAGRIPRHIALQLLGRRFNNFDYFRETFWKMIANDEILFHLFDERDLYVMKTWGYAPKVDPSQNVRETSSGRIRKYREIPLPGAVMLEKINTPKTESYVLHHDVPIHAGGGVYALSNLIIVTPRYHSSILLPKYHYNK